MILKKRVDCEVTVFVFLWGLSSASPKRESGLERLDLWDEKRTLWDHNACRNAVFWSDQWDRGRGRFGEGVVGSRFLHHEVTPRIEGCSEFWTLSFSRWVVGAWNVPGFELIGFSHSSSPSDDLRREEELPQRSPSPVRLLFLWWGGWDMSWVWFACSV